MTLATILSGFFPFQHLLCVTSNYCNLYFVSTCYGRLTLWTRSLEDAQVVLRCAFVRKKQYKANLKGFLFVSHFRFQADHIGMTLAKAEALFHLTEFEQALLHFHNGLVRFCQSLCSSSPPRPELTKIFRISHRSWIQETRRSTWESEDVGALCVNFFQTMSSRLLTLSLVLLRQSERLM